MGSELHHVQATMLGDLFNRRTIICPNEILIRRYSRSTELVIWMERRLPGCCDLWKALHFPPCSGSAQLNRWNYKKWCCSRTAVITEIAKTKDKRISSVQVFNKFRQWPIDFSTKTSAVQQIGFSVFNFWWGAGLSFFFRHLQTRQTRIFIQADVVLVYQSFPKSLLPVDEHHGGGGGVDGREEECEHDDVLVVHGDLVLDVQVDHQEDDEDDHQR